MKTKKHCFSVSAFLLVPALAFLFFAGCEMPPSPKTEEVITYTVRADGARDALNSTRIDFEFSRAITSLDESSVNIMVDTGNVERGEWTGGENIWSLMIAVKTPGDLKVKISRDGIEGAEKIVTVYREPVPETAAAPEAYPPGRTFQDSITVALESATEGAEIYYTLDNSVPEQGESGGNFAYTGPIVLDAHSILKAKAFKEGLEPSYVLREVYTKAGAAFATVGAPVAAPETPLTFYTDTLTISLASETEGASIYYTLDGSEASRSGALYTGPFAIGDGAAYGKITLKAIAVKDFMNDSEAAAWVYDKGNAALPYARAPVFSVLSGAIDPGGTVALSSATDGAAIYYTLDESTPTVEDGALYTGPIAITERTVIKAIAAREGMNASEAAESKYLPRINEAGINWLDISAEIPKSTLEKVVAWDGARYVLITSPGELIYKVAYSADLIHWTEGGVVFSVATTSGANNLAMAWGKPGGAGRFVAVNGQNVSYSPDGITWTESRVLSDRRFKSITWGGPAGQELFVAGTSDNGGGPGDIYWSSDGIAWTRVVDDKLKGYAQKIIWEGGKFVALDSSQRVRIAYSPDGKEWINGSLEAYIFHAITYTGTEYVVCGYEREGSSKSADKIWSSSDLETWTETTTEYSHLRILWNNGTIYSNFYYPYTWSVNTLPPDPRGGSAYSTDKTTWTIVSTLLFGNMFTFNGKVVILGTGKMVVQE
jgi:hypothetical protein